MITPAYSITATERVLPRMMLDFTTASLDSRVSVSRALNTATRVNSSGFIETVNANLPRFDYDPVTKLPRGLLIEETRANTLPNSEDFTSATYNTLRGTLTPDATTSPANTLTAEKFTENNTSATRATQIAAALSVTSGSPYSFSTFLKNGVTDGRRYVSLIIVNNSTGLDGFLATFDLQTGTYTTQNRGTGAIISAIMQPFGDGWYRCGISGNATENAILFYISPATTATPTQGSYGRELYTGDGLKNFFLWGAQFEAAASVSSYIPTTTTGLTRNADDVGMTGTNFSDWYNANSGSWVTAFRTADTDPGFLGDQTVASAIAYSSASDFKTFNGVTQIVASGSYTVNINAKGALAYDSSGRAICLNGGTVSTDAALMQTVTRLDIGRSFGSVYLNGHMQKISYYSLRLTNQELQAFSKL